MNARFLHRTMITVLFLLLSLIPWTAVFANPESSSLLFISEITNLTFWVLMLFIIKEDYDDYGYYDWG